MKKLFLFFLTFLTLALTSCEKQKIYGDWVYKLTESEENINIEGKATITFSQNGKGKASAQIVTQQVEEFEGIPVLIKITCSIISKFDWDLKDDEIVFAPYDADIKNFTYKMYDNNTMRYLGELNAHTPEVANVIKGLKDEMMKANTEKIIMLQDKKFVTESYEDGKKTTYNTYNRIE